MLTCWAWIQQHYWSVCWYRCRRVGCSNSTEDCYDWKWIAFGTEKDLHFVSFHDISASLSHRKSLAVLLVFQAFTGCDTVSHFAQGGEKTCSLLRTSQCYWGNQSWCVFSYGTFRHTHAWQNQRFGIRSWNRATAFRAKGLSNCSSTLTGDCVTTTQINSTTTR